MAGALQDARHPREASCEGYRATTHCISTNPRTSRKGTEAGGHHFCPSGQTRKGHTRVWQGFRCHLKSLQLTSSSSSSSSSDSRTPSSKSSMKKNKLIRKPTKLVTWSLSVIQGTHVSIICHAADHTPPLLTAPDHCPSTLLIIHWYTHLLSWPPRISHSLLPLLAIQTHSVLSSSYLLIFL